MRAARFRSSSLGNTKLTLVHGAVELAFEQQRRHTTDGQQNCMRELLDSLIVWPSRNLVSSATTLPCNFSGMAKELHRWTGSDFAFILDLRGFNHSPSDLTPPPSPSLSQRSLRSPDSALQSRPTSVQSGRPTPPASPNSGPGGKDYLHSRKPSAPHRRDAKLHGPGIISVMDVECGESDAMTAQRKRDWEAAINSSAGVNGIAKALADWHRVCGAAVFSQARQPLTTAPCLRSALEQTGQIAFSVPVATQDNPVPVLDTPLAGVLTSDVKAIVAVPVFDHEGEPAIYVVVGSRKQHFQYELTDQSFVQSVGALLVAGMLQERILAADKAKQAFLSQVSHGARLCSFSPRHCFRR